MLSSKNSISHTNNRKAYFESLPVVSEISHPVKNYNSFINYFHKCAIKYNENICAYYQDIDSKGEITVKKLTYEQVDRISSNLACTLYPSLSSDSMISLIDTHSIHYYILSLALYKLRIPILLLSTRNSSQSAVHLLKQTDTQTLIYGKSYTHIKDGINKLISIKFLPVPDINIEEMINLPLNPDSDKILNSNFTTEDLSKTLLIVHSSGTTGTPKAVHWTNQYTMYCIQLLQYTFKKRNQIEILGESSDITINLAPLYHTMGLFSNYYTIGHGASIFFFYSFPPSVDQVFHSMKSILITRLLAPPSYVTQMIHIMKEKNDAQPFKKLKLVMSGGAPTSKATDEFLLKHKINFASLHGMSECIGILSSEISQNRIDSNTYFFLEGCEDHAYMEPFDENRYQLVFRAGSFYVAAGFSNRINGDYETKDLFIKSEVKDYGYIYVGRADDILIMSNGEKTDPLPIEDMIRANQIVSHCTVIGAARPCLAVLIELNFEYAQRLSLDFVTKSVQEIIQKVNINTSRHSVILREMIKIIPFDKSLPVSDKGTVIRKRAMEQFEKEINEMYSNFLLGTSRGAKLSHKSYDDINDVRSNVLKIVHRVLGIDIIIKNDVSLFKQGLNSILAIQLRNYISEYFYEVPQTFFYEYQTIEEIINALENNSILKNNIIPSLNNFDYERTIEILNKYLKSASKDFEAQAVADNINLDDNGEHIVLITGVTGGLGAYILSKLLDNVKVKKIYAFVRRKEGMTLMDRIVDTFQKQNYSISQLSQNSRVEAIPMDLNKDRLGLSVEIYDKLRSEVTMIQACGWLLDFNQSISYFDTECIKGTYNLIKFANRTEGSIPFHFISSISASNEIGNSLIHEVALPSDPRIASPMGYGQSKFVVEQLLNYLIEQKRQLSGDRVNCSWNTTEMFPLLLIGGGIHMKKLPNLNIVIDWLPLDIAGDTIVSIMMKTTNNIVSATSSNIFHIVNPNEVSWSSLLDTLKICGMQFETVDPDVWVKELVLQRDNPAYRLLNFYQRTFTNKSKIASRWETVATSVLVPDINDTPTINDFLPRYWAFWKKNGFYSN